MGLAVPDECLVYRTVIWILYWEEASLCYLGLYISVFIPFLDHFYHQVREHPLGLGCQV